ncbi:hypothetical protein INP57_24995 [Saccharopolyspora sp. HNM0986]|uniref:hypothetical protein n=1 Tax=Saccharopolyspora galaxeae TaxID=2781241 RepID=UPI00190B2792|nr:hypothetical protein [Saccharopolyspora sp. HNM0986]MBK0870073.1 hypothetical protein [Saccharopolyspora sp. HNM0986]
MTPFSQPEREPLGLTGTAEVRARVGDGFEEDALLRIRLAGRTAELIQQEVQR